MVAVKGIHQVFTLGIRFSGWISVCSRTEWRIGNSVGGTWRDFIRGSRWWWHKTLKLSLLLGINLCILLFLSFFLVPPLCDISQMWMDIFPLRCMLKDREGKCCIFKGVTKAQDVRGWILDLHCHCPLFRSAVYTSPLLCIVNCCKEQIYYRLTSPTCCRSGNADSLWLTRAQALHVCSFFFQLVKPHKRKSHQVQGSVLYSLRIIKRTWCQKVNFNSAPTQQADRAGRQHKQRGCICFSCENQWAQTDGGLFPHYLLPGSMTNVLATPPELTVHR